MTNQSTANTTATSTEELFSNYAEFPEFMMYGVLFVSTASFLLNATVAIALYRARRLKPVLRVLLFNLAITDALAGLVNIYHMIATRLISSFSVECIVRYAFVVELIAVTLSFIFLLSLDRVIALSVPLHYNHIVTEERLWVTSALIWLTMLAYPVVGLWNVDTNLKLCILQIMLSSTTFFVYGGSSLAIFLTVCCFNIFTVSKAISYVRKFTSVASGEGKEERITAMNHKTAITSLAIVVPFILLNTPHVVLFLLFAIIPNLKTSLTGLIAVRVCLGLFLANGLVNPLLYAWRSPEVRAEVKKMFRVCASGQGDAERRSSAGIATISR